jgi:hypothetical protein
MQQRWFCEACKIRGTVEHEEGDGVYQVAHQINAAHASASPECGMQGRAIRVVVDRQFDVAEEYREA